MSLKSILREKDIGYMPSLQLVELLCLSCSVFSILSMRFIGGVGIGFALPSLDALITEGIEKKHKKNCPHDMKCRYGTDFLVASFAELPVPCWCRTVPLLPARTGHCLKLPSSSYFLKLPLLPSAARAPSFAMPCFASADRGSARESIHP